MLFRQMSTATYTPRLVVTLSPEDNVNVAKRRSIVCMCRFHFLRALCSSLLVLKCTRCLLICFPTRNVDSLNTEVLTLTSQLPVTFLLWWTGSCASLPPTRWIMILRDSWICLINLKVDVDRDGAAKIQHYCYFKLNIFYIHLIPAINIR